jgi:hypothetical protein
MSRRSIDRVYGGVEVGRYPLFLFSFFLWTWTSFEDISVLAFNPIKDLRTGRYVGLGFEMRLIMDRSTEKIVGDFILIIKFKIVLSHRYLFSKENSLFDTGLK